MVVICANLSDNKEERPSLPSNAIMTFQKSPQFKNLFDQLEFTANEGKVAIEALVSIALRAGAECSPQKLDLTGPFLKIPMKPPSMTRTRK